MATPPETTVSLTGPAPQEAIHHAPTWQDRTRSVIKHVLLIAASLILQSRHDYLRQCLRHSSTGGPWAGVSCDVYTDAWRYASPAYQTGTPALGPSGS